jgi:hypothetical protein
MLNAINGCGGSSLIKQAARLTMRLMRIKRISTLTPALSLTGRGGRSPLGQNCPQNRDSGALTPFSLAGRRAGDEGRNPLTDLNTATDDGSPDLSVGGYLQRLQERRDTAELKRVIVFGLVLGWLLVIVCGSKYLFVVGAKDALWKAGMWLGFVILGITVIVPSLLTVVEHAFKAVGEVLGKAIFAVLLGIIYFVLFTPVGLIMQRRGVRPFHSWKDLPRAEEIEGWVPKEQVAAAPGAAATGTSRNLPLIAQPFLVLGYFIRNGRYVFVPALVLMIVFGLVLFFVQSSALAPFIYTLF